MTVHELELTNFRSYPKVKQELSPGVNLILGENAQGKTNFLESLFFLSCVKGFHAKQEKELILFGEQNARIDARVETRERELSLRVELSLSAKRKIYENGILQKRLLDYVGTLQTVLFSPDDLSMVKEGPALRRRFLNIAISQLRPNYIQTLAEYNRILEHKNKILKNAELSGGRELLGVFNEKLAETGAVLIRYRQEFVNILAKYAKIIHSEMSGTRETLQISYHTDRFVEDPGSAAEVIKGQLLDHLEARRAAELDAQSCLIGPHKDDLEFEIDGRPAKFFASQGQIRTAVLALKMAERDVFAEVTGEIPVLLLDDVLSELDEGRQAYLLHRISKGQVFISSCQTPTCCEMERGAVFQVEKGKILRTE